MNKNLIKTIASITCGLGVITSIPFMSTSCGSTSDPDETSDVWLELVGGSDSIIDHQGDYVDYLIHEPKSPNTNSVKNNGHSVAKFEFSDPSGSTESIKDWFDGYDPTAIPTPHPEDPDWAKEWPVYGFHYDEINDQWHFKFKMAKEPDHSFNITIYINVSVPNGQESDVYNSPDTILTFKDPNTTLKVQPGEVSDFLFTFDKTNYLNYDINSLVEVFKANNTLVKDGGPSASSYYNADLWSSFLIKQYQSEYAANLFAFFYVLEAYNFIKYCFDTSNDTMYYPQWDTEYNTFLIPETNTDNYKLSNEDLDNLSITVNINQIKYVPSVSSGAEISNSAGFTADCSMTIKVGQDQKTAVCAYIDRYKYVKLRMSPPVVCTSKTQTLGDGQMYLQNLSSNLDYSSDAYFIIKMAGNFMTEVTDHPDYQMFNAFHYITAENFIDGGYGYPCYDTVGMKKLLVALFPEYEQDAIVPRFN